MKKILAGIVICAFVSMICVGMISTPERDRSIDQPWIVSNHAPIAPIVIASDADWVTFAASGSGTAIDPWIIEDFTIDCGGAGSAIAISGTTDHAIIRDGFVNDTGPGALDCGISMIGASNIDLDRMAFEWCSLGIAAVSSSDLNINSTIVRYAMAGTAIGFDDVHDTVVNNTEINNGTIYVARFMTASTSENIIFDAINVTNSSEPLRFSYVENSSVSNSHIDGLNDHAGIVLGVSAMHNNITSADIENCSVAVLVSENENRVENNTIHDIIDYGISFNTVDYCDVVGNTIYNVSGFGYGVNVISSNFINVRDNVISNASIGVMFEITHWSNVTNNVLFDNMYGNAIHESQNITVDDNTCYDNLFGILAHGTTDSVNITNNTCYNSYAGIVISEPHYCNILNNTLTGNVHGIEIRDGANYNTIMFNKFMHNSAHQIEYMVDPFAVDANIVLNNFYDDYFDYFAYDVTINLTSMQLQSEYAITTTTGTTVNDTSPLYDPVLYPRATMVYLNFYSNVDGMGIAFSNLAVLLDGVPLTVTYPVITHVLFRLTISDFRGRLLSDVVYNLNDTGIYINIGLDIAVQIWIFYSSTLDGQGVAFADFKLYIDGVRCPINNPIMDHEIILFTVRDYFNQLIYNSTWNLTATGIYIDIPLAVTTIVVSNDFDDRNVLFHYETGGISNSFPIKAGKSIEVRVALGFYDWWITDAHGHPIQNQAGDDDVDGSKNIVGQDFVDFGWITIAPQPGNVTNDYNSPIFDLVTIGAFIGLAFGAILVVKAKIPDQATSIRKRKQLSMRDK
jgi:parallel beta-helix repeat protein